ncbi:MAG: nicotinate phosphoribosyltransferase [Syntrophorhabdaceae bacterium]|nr:nicotinate phosphoribosyltransferase [Syntrophorhabdaceae bacterium]
MFFVADLDDIKKGKVTDVYFERTLEILKKKSIDKWVRAEFIVKRLPDNIPWAIFSGTEEVSQVVDGLNVKIRSMREGTVIKPYQPVLEIEGMYTEFGVMETAILGLICQSSGVATKAARCKKAAGNKPVISFGARRVHPAIAPMVERSAFIGGCDGVSVVYDAETIGEEPAGTMPHALILIIGDTVDATLAFDEVIDKKIKRVALIDTFNDEKVEALRVADALKEKLYAVRLDTPSTRRGDFLKILEEVRWELNIRGYGHVKIFVSGGIDEKKILQLNQYADSYGVGTTITNAKVVDFAMDIIEIEGKPVAKRGKMSGAKRVLRCMSCCKDKVVPLDQNIDSRCDCGGEYVDLLNPWYEKGKFLEKGKTPQAIRKYVLEQLKALEI